MPTSYRRRRARWLLSRPMPSPMPKDGRKARSPKLGQRVLFKKYAGHLHERNGRKYRILNDKDLVAIIETHPNCLWRHRRE
jgi:hypothetical protein